MVCLYKTTVGQNPLRLMELTNFEDRNQNLCAGCRGRLDFRSCGGCYCCGPKCNCDGKQ